MTAEIRNALAQAASAVDGIECSAYFVAGTEAGTAMVRLDRTEYPNRFGGVDFWQIVVILPQDYADAEAYVDRITPELRDELSPYLVVTETRPQRLDLPGIGVLPCLFISGFREKD